MKQLEIEKTKPTFIISVLKVDVIKVGLVFSIFNFFITKSPLANNWRRKKIPSCSYSALFAAAIYLFIIILYWFELYLKVVHVFCISLYSPTFYKTYFWSTIIIFLASNLWHLIAQFLQIFSKVPFLYIMAIRVVQFSNGGYKIRKIFA